MAAPLVSLPARVKRGEIFEVKTLVAHPMETGYRPGLNGALIPRDIVRRLICRFGIWCLGLVDCVLPNRLFAGVFALFRAHCIPIQ